MEMVSRRRTGKGVGADQGQGVTQGAQNSHGETDRGAESTGEVEGRPRSSVDMENSVGAGESQALTVPGANPFWSQRAQEEWQLQHFLGTATETHSSSSTELRTAEHGVDRFQGPSGPPVVLGPSALRTTVAEDRTFSGCKCS